MRLVACLALALCGASAACDVGGGEPERATGTTAVTMTADGWKITVTSARTEGSLAGSHQRTFSSRPGETFLVVEATFRSGDPGRELAIRASRALVADREGRSQRAVGGGDDGVCVDCNVTFSTTDREVRFRFVFTLREPVPTGLAFRYAGSEPVPLPLEGSSGGLAAPSQAATWTKVAPGGRTECARGGRYAFWFHEGDPTRLLVFFQGGGGCFDVESCAPGSQLFDDSVTADDDPAVSEGGVLDLDDPENPFGGYSVLYVPSCTGDVHWGDNVRTYTGGGRSVTIRHRGFVNARAAIDWVGERVPSPKRVFVTGCSAGSVGSAVFAPYLIERYRAARVTQLGDSLGFVFHRPLDLNEDYRAHDNFPHWIPELREVEPGTFTMARYYAAITRHYRRSVFSQFNYARDEVQRMFYEAVGGDGDDFADALERSLDEIRRTSHNFRCYTADGDGHCVLNRRDFYSHETSGVRLRDWVAALEAGRPVDDVEPD